MTDLNGETAGLLLILHGSPREESADPARQMAKLIQSTGKFRHTAVAFMECNSPTIAEGVHLLAARGANPIVVVPYLLHPGRHLVLDIPNQLREACQQHPGLVVKMADCVGLFPGTTQALLGTAIKLS